MKKEPEDDYGIQMTQQGCLAVFLVVTIAALLTMAAAIFL